MGNQQLRSREHSLSKRRVSREAPWGCHHDGRSRKSEGRRDAPDALRPAEGLHITKWALRQMHSPSFSGNGTCPIFAQST
eukprot:3921316-Rhodomonas_salina.2